MESIMQKSLSLILINFIIIMSFMFGGCDFFEQLTDNFTQTGDTNDPEDQTQPGNVCKDCKIDAVYIAQTHVLPPNNKYFRLVSDRKALLKVQVIKGDNAENNCDSPEVKAVLTLNGKDETIILKGPKKLSKSFQKALGKVQHTYDDSFTAFIPATWVQPGLEIKLKAGNESKTLQNLNIGAPNRFTMTMFDFKFFKDIINGGHPEGWFNELEAKWPVAGVELRRVPKIILKEVVMLPVNKPDKNKVAPAIKVTSTDDYEAKTGSKFDGEQAVARQWLGSLHKAAGLAKRNSLYYITIWGLDEVGGNGGDFHALGGVDNCKLLNHETGHAFGLNHAWGSESYPYHGDMYGIPVGRRNTHVGPTWGFDLPSGRFISPVIPENTNHEGDIPGTYKSDGMCGGGCTDHNDGFIFGYWSDHHLNKIQMWMENNIVFWNSSKKKYFHWDNNDKAYSKPLSNNGNVQYPVKYDVKVYSLLVGVSEVTPKSTIVYPPIGPYISGVIKLFDPRKSEDRTNAKKYFCPDDGCDVSLRIKQTKKETIAMLPIEWKPSVDQYDRNGYSHAAMNLEESDGKVTNVELLQTLDADSNGLPSNPKVLYTWKE